MPLKNNHGFAYIDLIIGMVIIAIAVLPILLMITNMTNQHTQTLLLARGTTFSNSVMQQIRSARFDELDNPPWSALGSDFGDRDDIDDYIDNADWSAITGFSDFNVAVSVYYIDPSSSWTDPVGGWTNYKIIIVTVSHQNLNTSLTLSSIMTPFGYF
jgi:Tfp pilus assembly protein PilV